MGIIKRLSNRLFKSSFLPVVLLVLFQLQVINAIAQDSEQEDPVAEALIKLSFSQTDSTKTCTALVMADTVPLSEKDVMFYVQRSFSLLPIGRGAETTDENGEAVMEFPLDLPGDENGMLVVIAKIEDDDTYGTVETSSKIKWGVMPETENSEWAHRSLSASRDKAPMYLIIVSNSIIAIIWGTIFYIILQLIKIKKSTRPIRK